MYELLNIIPCGIFIITKENDSLSCTFCNTYLLNLLNISDITFFLTVFFDLIHPDDKITTIAQYNDCISNNLCIIHIFRLSINNTFTWFRLISSILNNSYHFILYNIHDSKLLENKTTECNLQKIQRANFLSQQSHSIRTPINGILGAITLLESTPLSSIQREYFYMLRDCSIVLMSTINDLLDFAKLEANNLVLRFEDLLLTPSITYISDIIMSKLNSKHIKYIFSISSSITTSLFFDPNRLRQILLNLLYNSLNFTESGFIQLNIYKISFSDYCDLMSKYNPSKKLISDLDYIPLRFDVIDTGHGIVESDYSNLFNPYIPLSKSAGLGLFISKELISLMNGCIWLDWSSINHGSRFSFVLYLKSGSISISDHPISSISDFSEKSTDTTVLLDKLVVLIDSNLSDIILLTNLLHSWGMKVTPLNNVTEAILSYRTIHYDLCIVNIDIPSFNNNSFAHQLKSLYDIPLFAISSHPKNISSLFSSCLSKPIDPSILKQHCINFLNTNSTINSLLSILIIDDVYINRQIISKFLYKIGYNHVTECTNGQECLSLVYKTDFHILLLDIRMPVMDGVEVLANLNTFYKNNPSRRRPIVIALTSYGDEYKQSYLEMGFDDFLSKPLTINDLKTTLLKYYPI